VDKVRGKYLKWLCLISLLVFSLATVSVTSTGSTVVFVNPPILWDDTLQAGNTFTVDIDG